MNIEDAKKRILSELSQEIRKLDFEQLSDVLYDVEFMLNTPRLQGGPLDGLEVTREHADRYFLYVQCGEGNVAVYERDDETPFRFTGKRRIGEGCMPDIWTKDLIDHV